MEVAGRDYSKIVDQCLSLIAQGKNSVDIDGYLQGLGLSKETVAKVIYDIQDYQVEFIKIKQQRDKARIYYLLGGSCMLCAVVLQVILLFNQGTASKWLGMIFIGGYLLIRKGQRASRIAVESSNLSSISKADPLRDSRGIDFLN